MGGDCEESYGVLPCSTTLGGSTFLVLVYGYIILQGANTLSNGSELLLEILNPGIIGGLLLPVLGALPDACIIVAAANAPIETAAEEVAVGLGTLAGSTIMLLTIAWGGSLLLGRCDLSSQGRMINKKLTRGTWDLTHTGVTTDSFTPLNSRIMMASVLLYLIIQIPASFGTRHSATEAALVGGVVCMVSLILYCAFQVLYPELQKRRIEAAKKRRDWQRRTVQRLSTFGTLLKNGKLDQKVADQLFDVCDSDNSGSIDTIELRAFLTGLIAADQSVGGDIGKEVEQEIVYWYKEFDQDLNKKITREEFASQLSHWAIEMRRLERRAREFPTGEGSTDMEGGTVPLLEDEENEQEDGEGEEEGGKESSPVAIACRAALLMLVGTAICAVISDPLVGAVTNFSRAADIPPFFVAFVINPLASNASELISSLRFAAAKKSKNISLTYSQVYGAVTMNNTMNLGLFLLLVYMRQLSWTYTSEVVVIVGTTLLVGALGAYKTTFQTFWAFPVAVLYPLSLVVVYVMDHVFGIS